jgi:transposase
MIRIFDKSTINKFIVKYLSKAKRGFISKVPIWQIVNAILYKFKSGVQWALLPVKSLITKGQLKYGAIYHHFRKWTLDGSWQRAWQALLKQYRHLLDLSIALFDGTHTIAKRGGGKVSYQSRKRNKTTNTLWLVDRQGMVVSFVPPLSGKHNDIFAIEKHLEIIVAQLNKSAISVDGLFLNADAGFDSKAFRAACNRFGIIPNVPRNVRRTKHLGDDDTYFDDQMYEERFIIERSNAWMDFNRTFLIRFDTSIESWITWHYIFSIVQWTRFITKV